MRRSLPIFQAVVAVAAFLAFFIYTVTSSPPKPTPMATLKVVGKDDSNGVTIITAPGEQFYLFTSSAPRHYGKSWNLANQVVGPKALAFYNEIKVGSTYRCSHWSAEDHPYGVSQLQDGGARITGYISSCSLLKKTHSKIGKSNK